MIFAAVVLSFLLASCTEEGFTKVFKCDDKYPFFSTITHKCYESEDTLAKGEKDYLEAEENAKKGSEEEEEEEEE